MKYLGIGVLLLLVSSSTLWALNGAQLPGYSAATEALAGSGGSAAHLDSSTMLTNPAALSEVARSFRLGILFGFTNLSFSSVANPGVAIAHNDNPPVLPSGSLVYSFMDGRLNWGLGAFGVAGFGSDFSASPLGAGAAFGTHSLYGLLKIVDAMSYQLNDRMSIGAALHFNRETLESNGSTAAGTPTTGTDRTDAAYGFGGAVGFLYKLRDDLHLGVNYTSEQFFNNFERYLDILPRGLNYPQQANAGVAYWPLEDLMVAADFRWINWGGAGGGFGDSLTGGGLGWRDQYIGMGGVQYHLFKPLLVRAGYNYGRTAVPSNALFVNSLSTALGKHHLGMGVGLRLIENIDADLSYMRAFSSTVTDTGTLAPGSSATLAGHQATIDVTVRF